MQLIYLQIGLGVLALALVAIGVAIYAKKKGLPKIPRPALSVPKVPLPKKRAREEEEVITLPSSRLQRLQTAAEEKPQPVHEDFDAIEARLEELFTLFEAGKLDLSFYREKVVEELDRAQSYEEALSHPTADPELAERAGETRQAVQWCINWADEFAKKTSSPEDS
ncbi:MAG: hypothetical protein R3E18_00320 [Sphingomonadaceae bacterium]|nr:hypothetical protein [Sphingomonadaceae bacterium]